MTELDCYGKERILHEEDAGEPSVYAQYLLGRWCYLMAEPYLSDIEYDRIEKQFKQWYPNDEHSKQPWAFDTCPAALLEKYGKASLICNPVMGYSAESIASLNSYTDVENMFLDLSEDTRLSFKIDGWNTRVSYLNGHLVKVQTRGRSGNNMDINHLRKLFPEKIPIKGRVAITGEMSIPNDKWPMVRAMTGNSDQRASIRTMIAQDGIDYLSYLAFNIFVEDGLEVEDTYKYLNELGFKTPDFYWVKSWGQLQMAIARLSDKAKDYNYLTDGLVIENSKVQRAIRIGAWLEQNMCSYVTGYEENPGMYGTYLKVLCRPIKNEGKVFRKVSINNIALITENNLQVGFPIAFNLRSAANVVIDSSATKDLQRRWVGRYEEYRNEIDNKMETLFDE